MRVETPTLIEGSISMDDRGSLAFVNDFDFAYSSICRLYLTSNHRAGQVRAWHAHKRERKFVMAVAGSALVCAAGVINWRKPRRDTPVCRFTLSAAKPAILAFPAGYANGWMSLTDDARLLWFSTATLAESAADDYRFPARYWDCWKVEER